MDDGHPSPLEPDQLDEVLTAELDGELDAVAHDLGLDAEELTARLGATPGVAERRADLAAARELLAQVPELDELAAVRLRSDALRAAEHEHAARGDSSRGNSSRGQGNGGGRWMLAAGGIAAAVVAIGGLAVVIGGHGASNSKSSSAVASPYTSAAAPKSPAPSAVASLGAFADERALALTAVARGQARDSTASTAAPGLRQQDELAQQPNNTTTNAPATQPSANKSVAPSTSSGFATSDSPSTAVARNGVSSSAKAAQRAPANCGAPAGVPVSGQLVLRATATLLGRAVVVLVYVEKNAHQVVIEDTECGFVNLQTVP